MINNEAHDVIKKLFGSLENRSWNHLESMKVREFLFDCGQLLYKRHKINPNHFGLYIDSPCWIKKTIINPINKKDKYFQYTVTAVLNHEETAKNPERITNIKSFINKYE